MMSLYQGLLLTLGVVTASVVAFTLLIAAVAYVWTFVRGDEDNPPTHRLGD